MKEAKNMQHRVQKEGHIHFSQLAAYGAGGIIPIALYNATSILIGMIGNISLGLSAFWLGFILIIPRLWEAFSDPLIGHISDNTRTRWGRRRPYLLIGGILVAIFFVVIWWIPKGEVVHHWFPTESGFQLFQLAYILFSLVLFFTAVNIFEIPHGALGMELTTDYHGRTRLFSAKSFIGNLFAMMTPWLFALANLTVFKGTGGNEADGMRYVSIMIAGLIIPLSFWWTFQLREPGFVKVAKQTKTPFWQDMRRTVTNRNFIFLTLTIFTLAMGFNFVQLLGSYIPIFYAFSGHKEVAGYLLGINGTIWAITGLLAVFPLNWISPKVGKRSTLIIAIVLMCLAQLSKIVCYSTQYPYLVIIPTIMLSAGMLFFFTLGSSMVGDICDEDELHTGKRSEGSYYAIFWWFIKMGTAFASLVAGALIVLTMFDQTQVSKVDAFLGSVRELRSEVQSPKSQETYTADFDMMLEKTRSCAVELTKHLESSQKANGRNLVHYNQLLQNMSEMNNRLSALNSTLPADSIISELDYLESRILPEIKYFSFNILGKKFEIPKRFVQGKTVPLTKQTPYTLLMMRAVEIGLPLLLSLFSIFFVLRYSLTEKRSHEIKELLKQRNAGRENGNPEPVSD